MAEHDRSAAGSGFTKGQPASFWKRLVFFGAIKSGNVSKVQNVLEKGFDPNANLYHGVTPLSLAVKYERFEIVRTLLRFSADPDLADENTGLTPLLHCIIEDSPLEMMSVLIRGNADLNRKDGNGMSPLHHCVNEGKLEPFRLLLESGADPNVQDFDGVTCMNLAKSSHGMSEFAELLLKHGADPMIKDKHGKIYLM
ncbi:ankyrin repeat domain-containing protein [Leptospira sp. FAT2]|uniref:ankyrin repeat domain-containing protein n=1 Tax=Leptospira sanjuanensis TaxID=2879643 RepID=UPI001EE8EBA4|nr:ankyrin repeat domain-containing protein [Leptospira sanjuanensis]MCG6194718.1 ankyrin repeat domain-containing protein [Leptospira sanjuanensis]